MRLRHARRQIELHLLQEEPGPALLYVHELFGHGREAAAWLDSWRGPVWAVDLPGHGESEWLLGGAYSPEYLAASVDIALARIGTAALLGRGLGAYLSLLIAGGRAEQVPVAGLLPGRGLRGAGDHPTPSLPLRTLVSLLHDIDPRGSDPLAAALNGSFRPADYALRFASAARRLILLEDGRERPPWWSAIAGTPQSTRLKGRAPDLLAAMARTL